MAGKNADKSPKVEKSVKRDKSEKKSKKEKKPTGEKQDKAANAAVSLLADKKAVNPALSSLFAAQPTPPVRQEIVPEPEEEAEDDDPDAELSEIDEDFDDEGDVDMTNDAEDLGKTIAVAEQEVDEAQQSDKKRKRKRKDAGDEIEDVYMRKLEKEEARDAEAAAKERATKRQKGAVDEEAAEESDDDDDDGVDVRIEAESDDDDDDDDDDVPNVDEEDESDDATPGDKARAPSPPPKHETQTAAENDITKANRTVFLGNVSTAAITSKSARKVFITHLTSFFPDVKSKDPKAKFKLESLRFRSTPYAAALPKKAAYAKKELMDATTKSTNAYAVYSSPILSREAARRLNATKILDRHLRVDEIAHPAKIDHKRCVFIGNLGFVDDESNIQAANAADGREQRKPGKQPADHEEGLWRTMSRHGAVESVRVIRDSVTRVGKGIAYVQFADENSVEAALLDNEKKFPPMLPRKLRVSRAKAQKRNAKPGSGRPGANAKAAASGYKRKVTEEELAQMGRQGKLLGKAGAAAMVKSQQRPAGGAQGGEKSHALAGLKRPEAFVFEGHRASSKQGNQGLKLGGKGSGKKKQPQRQGKPTDRSAKRGAAFKAGGGKKGKSS